MLFIIVIVLLMRGLIGSGCVINFSVVRSREQPAEWTSCLLPRLEVELGVCGIINCYYWWGCVCGENEDGHWLI